MSGVSSSPVASIFDANVQGEFPAWISYLNLSILLGSLALALFNASRDNIARNFAVFYAVVSVGILV